MPRKRDVDGHTRARLVEIRKTRGISQGQLARAIGVTVGTIQAYEHLEALAEALQCEPTDLLKPFGAHPFVPFAVSRFAVSDGAVATEMHAMPPETSAIATLGWVARAKGVAAKSYHGAALDFLVAKGAPERAQRILKAGIGAGSTADSDLGDYGIAIGAWSDSLRTRSVFYRLLADNAFTRVPMRTRAGMVTSTATGALVPEGQAVPVGRITLAGGAHYAGRWGALRCDPIEAGIAPRIDGK